jgi:hypothetical protein
MEEKPQGGFPSDTLLFEVDTLLDPNKFSMEERQKIRPFGRAKIPSYRQVVTEAGPDPLRQVQAPCGINSIKTFIGSMEKIFTTWDRRCSSRGFNATPSRKSCWPRSPRPESNSPHRYWEFKSTPPTCKRFSTTKRPAPLTRYRLGRTGEDGPGHGDIYDAAVFYHASLGARPGISNWLFHGSPLRDEGFFDPSGQLRLRAGL